LYIRAKETNQNWDQHKFDHISQRATDFMVHAGEEAAMKLINKEVKVPLNQFGLTKKRQRRGTFRFKRKRE
jgi:predicted thioesterase